MYCSGWIAPNASAKSFLDPGSLVAFSGISLDILFKERHHNLDIH